MSIFSRVPTAKIGRSAFPVGGTWKGTADMGFLYPVFCRHGVPGDVFKIGHQFVVKSNPTISPLLHDCFVDTFYFFVPHRILDEDFEEALTGGLSGESTKRFIRWNPYAPNTPGIDEVALKDTLWDNLGYPLHVSQPHGTMVDELPEGVDPDDCIMPLAYNAMSYNLTWNEFFRDENLQAEVGVGPYDDNFNYQLLKRNWYKDYFTSALLYEQRGTAPTFGFTGSQDVLLDPMSTYMTNYMSDGETLDSTMFGVKPDGQDNWTLRKDDTEYAASQTYDTAIVGKGTFDRAELGSWTIEDIRLANSVQKWMERSMICGNRYTEYLRSMYGVFPRDERLQRPEFIGSTHTPVFQSEIPQTSASETTGGKTSAQGFSVSKLSAVGSNYIGKYRCLEFGTVFGLMCIVPRPSYIPQGFPREWLWQDRYDFYNPLFQHLGQQAITMNELYATGVPGDSGDEKVFGYQGRYDELRVPRDISVGEMRDTFFQSYTLDRVFDSKPGLNSDFIQCNPDTDRIKALPSEPLFVVNFYNDVKAYRPLTKYPQERL